jgi:transposase InsO family protein
VRCGHALVAWVVFHTDRGSTYAARLFTGLCERLGVRQSMGRGRSCFDNAAAEAFFSTLEHEVATPRRHSFARLRSPDHYEKTTAEHRPRPDGARTPLSVSRAATG